jgi:hypothetical protein
VAGSASRRNVALRLSPQSSANFSHSHWNSSVIPIGIVQSTERVVDPKLDMAEAIGIVGSIIAILQLSGTAIGYLREVKNRDCPRLRSSLRTTEGVLKTLQETVNDAQADPPGSWSKTIKILNEPGGPLPQLEDVVSSINIILQKHATGPRKFLWPFKKDEVDELVGTLKGLESLIQLALANDHIALTKEVHRNIDSIKRGVDNLRVAQDKALALENDHVALSKEIYQATKHIEAGVRELRVSRDEVIANGTEQLVLFRSIQLDMKWIRQQFNGRNKKQIISALSTLDFTPQLHYCLDTRLEGSGQWFIETQEFQTWLTKKGKTLLCQGVPGAGKTIMASLAVEHLLDKHATKKSINVGVAYVFCDFRHMNVQKVADLLSSLLKQLVQGLPDVPDSVADLYATILERGLTPSLEKIENALLSTISNYDRVFIIVDALDEYCVTDDNGLSKLLSILMKIQNESSVNFLATSRPYAHIAPLFPKAVLRREIRANDDDVLQYINSRIPSLLSSRISRHPEVMQAIRDEVLKQNDGMFLLSRLHIDDLASQPSVGHIKRALRSWPKSLHDMYENALERINNQATQERKLANKVLSWLVQTKRTPSMAELQHVLATEPGMEDLDEGLLPVVGAICGGLVTVDQEADVVRLVHYSTREYLERHYHRLGVP